MRKTSFLREVGDALLSDETPQHRAMPRGLANSQASTTAAAKPSPQCGQRGGFRGRPPEAPIFRVVAKFVVSESQLRVERRAAAGALKLMKALQPCSGPLESIAKTSGTSRTRPETALDPGMFR